MHAPSCFMNDSAFGGRCNNFIFKISVTQPWTKPRRLKHENKKRRKKKERERDGGEEKNFDQKKNRSREGIRLKKKNETSMKDQKHVP